MKQQANSILGLLTQTSLHAGTGDSTGVIDLPIQREGHSGWPCVFGSAVKGAIRARAEAQFGKDVVIKYIFGSAADEEDSYAGAVSFSDARLLLFPVRSLTSQFKWVTCPAALKRYAKDASRLGQTINMDVLDEDKLSNTCVLLPKDQQADALFLEEYRFSIDGTDLKAIIEQLAPLMNDNDAEARLSAQLAIVSDDMFSYLVQHSTPVNAHIAIESETKIVKSGALWYQETLPPDTLLYTALSAVNGRATVDDHSVLVADTLHNSVLDLFPQHDAWLQLGGHETVGMGWCAVQINKIGG